MGKLPVAELRDALREWLRGGPVDAIVASHPEVWPTIENDLDALLPWVLTAAIEVAAAHVATGDVRDLAHRRLGISRLRYGVPFPELCDLVRGGRDRVLLTQLAAKYDNEAVDVRLMETLIEYVAERSQLVVDDEVPDED